MEPEDWAERKRWDWPYWTEQDVRRRLSEAAETLSRTRFPSRDVPSNRVTSWPEVFRSYWEEHNAAMEAGRKVEAKTTRCLASPGQIDKMDDVLPWLFWIEDTRDRSIVFLRALGFSWRKIATKIGGISHEFARNAERRGIESIKARLNREKRFGCCPV